MYKGLLETMEKHSDCYFQLFTNATLLTEEVAFRLKKMGNVTPLISIEGLKDESDIRRGKDGVLDRTIPWSACLSESPFDFRCSCQYMPE